MKAKKKETGEAVSVHTAAVRGLHTYIQSSWTWMSWQYWAFNDFSELIIF